jgi:superfamily I DNA/RNA helicase
MNSAIAGRNLDDADQKLSILAVSDDDQNNYTFRGANVQFIRCFQQDYAAEVHYLVENYRSTRHIIDAASTPVARLSKRAQAEWSTRFDAVKEVRFLAAIRRTAEQEADSARRERLQTQTWEIPLVEIVSEQPA